MQGTGPGCMASLTFHSLKKPSRCNKDNRRDGCFGKLRRGKKKIYLQPAAALHFLVHISSHCAQKLLSVWSLLMSLYQNDLQMAKQTANLPQWCYLGEKDFVHFLVWVFFGCCWVLVCLGFFLFAVVYRIILGLFNIEFLTRNMANTV